MNQDSYTRAYQELTQAANDAGLMDRRRGFYWTMIIGWTIGLAATVTAVILVGDSWFQLIIAALLGVVLSQLAFLGHEAAHQAIFSSHRWNEWMGRLLAGPLVGISYQWWLDKHNRHHATPNKHGEDPDVDSGAVAFTPEASDARTGLRAKLAKRQGLFFVPLLFLEGMYLHYISIRSAGSPRAGKHWSELVFMAARWAAYLALLLLVMTPGKAAAFLAVQIGVFGLLLGGAFAPNHIGMPTVAAGSADLDFLRRQVLTSRNVTGGVAIHFLMGGLEYQIEHHLFPMAPRPNLRRLQVLVNDACARQGVPYTQTTLRQAYTEIIGYLNQVGLKNRDPFTCPLVRQLRG